MFSNRKNILCVTCYVSFVVPACTVIIEDYLQLKLIEIYSDKGAFFVSNCEIHNLISIHKLKIAICCVFFSERQFFW